MNTPVARLWPSDQLGRDHHIRLTPPNWGQLSGLFPDNCLQVDGGAPGEPPSILSRAPVV